MHGKVGPGAGTEHHREGSATGPPEVGKRTLVEQVASSAVASWTQSPAPSGSSAVQAKLPPSSPPPDATINPMAGVPRLQLKDLFGRAPATAGGAAVQHKAQGGGRSAVEPDHAAAGGAVRDEAVHHIAAAGVSGASAQLPHLERIQRAFGADHDVAGIEAHVGGAAGDAAGQIGARAYATGNHIAFAETPDVHTAAHEAAHVVQQRGGVQLKGGVGAASDAHEVHTDAVADRVVRGESTAELLAQVPGGKAAAAGVQRAPAIPAAPAAPGGAEIAAPAGGVNLPGFIDTSDGANLRTGPAETGGRTVIDAPLPPATRVFVSGTHPSAPQWWYVTAFLPDKIARGYVQQFRVNTDLPEPLAKLHVVKAGDTVQKLAAQEYSSSVRDGHDLRYYENVLLYANQQRGRVGITGAYQDPGLLGGGANHIQLVAGHRIWLVSPAYAHAMEGVVPDGSLTNGAHAKLQRFVQHVVDIIQSITQSPNYFGEVAGEYAQAIRDHLPEIIGIIAGFVAAEAASAFLAATPTGVGQIAAVLIQLALSAFGAAGVVQAGVEALNHAGQWLTIAWTAKGDDKQIGKASREFLRMLVSIAMAALSYLGMKGNLGKAVKIAQSMPPVGLVPAVAGAGGRGGSMAGAGEVAKLGLPSPAGSFGTSTAMMTKHGEGEGSGPSVAKEPTGNADASSRGNSSESSPSDSPDLARSEHSRAVDRGSSSAIPKRPVMAAIKRLSGSDVTRGMEVDPTAVQVFRGGKGFKLKPGEVKVDRTTGLVQPTHGPSLDIVPDNVARFGGAQQVTRIPSELKVIQRGARIEHFEVVPRQPMTEAKFQQLLDAIEQE